MPTLFPAHVNVLGTFSLAAFPAEFRPYIVSFYLFPLLLYVVRVTFWCVLAGSTNKQVLVDSENNASLIGYSPVRSLARCAGALAFLLSTREGGEPPEQAHSHTPRRSRICAGAARAQHTPASKDGSAQQPLLQIWQLERDAVQHGPRIGATPHRDRFPRFGKGGVRAREHGVCRYCNARFDALG